MRIRAILLLGLTLALGSGVLPLRVLASPEGAEPGVTPVDFVDLERYAGLWHEIAKIPNRFQDQCAYGTTARYTLREDGRLDVVNRCFEEDGDSDEAEGLAKVVDAVSNAKLEVSFVSFLGWRPFWGDYWIIGLESDYRWAVVGTPDRKYGWVLARESELSDDAMAEVRKVLRENGYQWSDFELGDAAGPSG